MDAFEKHYTVTELAELWNVHADTIRRMFRDEAGVLKIGQSGRRRKRDYFTLRIPASVAARVHRDRSRGFTERETFHSGV